VADLLVVDEDVPVREEDFPVVLAGAYQSNIHGAGGGHVMADVEKILQEPEEAEGHAGNFAAEAEHDSAGKRNDEFKQRAAQNCQRVGETDLILVGKDSEQRPAS
jgi:hypothetical protein